MRAGSAAKLVLCTLLAPACSSSSRPPPAGGPDAGSAVPGGLLPGDAGDTFGGGMSCPVETKYVYVVTAQNDLYRFDPPTLAFTMVGHLSCPDPMASPYSMAVDRSGVAWVLFTDGALFQVDTKNALCRATSYEPGQHGFTLFGMGFSSNDAAAATSERLFVTQGDPSSNVRGLAAIDTTSLELTQVSDYDQLAGRRAEMTGTGDARLYGAFEGMPYVVAEIDKSSAKILSQAPQTGVSAPTSGSNFAFAFWGGDFWLFEGPGGATDVFRYRPSAKTTEKVTSVAFEIVGAGVSTCAPVAPPK